MKKFVFTIAIILAISANYSLAAACTIFSAIKNDITMVGNNENGLVEDVDGDVKVWFLPTEQGKFGWVYFGFEGGDPQGGMNEKGLFFDVRKHSTTCLFDMINTERLCVRSLPSRNLLMQ